MAARVLRCLAGLPLAALTLGAGVPAAAEVQVQGALPVPSTSPAASPRPGRPVLGLLADAGVPDGATAALVLRPVHWLRLHGGGGTNTVSAGYRAGLTLVPLGHGPSLSAEVGHYRDGNANGLVRRFVGANRWSSPLFERVAYTYVNTQAGLEFGRGRLAGFIHGGVSYLRAVLHGASDALAKRGATADGTRITLGSDPLVHVWTPSVKAGLIVYLEGK